MSRVKLTALASSLLILLLAAGCGGDKESTPAAQPTPIATVAAPQPTAEPTPEPTATPEPSDFPLTVVDSNGNEVTFDAPPERIVAMDSAVVEILFAIGEGDRIIGTHDFVDHPPETADIKRLGGASDMNIEVTLELEPDLVFLFFDQFLPDLQRAGLKVLYLETLNSDFIKVADTIRLWGRITGSPDRAETVAAEFEARVDDVRTRLADIDQGPSIFRDEGGRWTPGPDTLTGEVFELLKLRNVAHDVQGFAQMSPELIVERDPEYLVVSSYSDMADNPAFTDVSAIANDRIIILEGEPLSVAGPRFVDGIEALARAIYPDLFEP